MRVPAPPRRWLAWLLLLALSAGLGVPVFAADTGHHGAAATAAHGACVHSAHAAEPPWDDPDGMPDTPGAADCAFAHLGKALLDRPTRHAARAASFTYPSAAPEGPAGHSPGCEGDPPRPARAA